MIDLDNATYAAFYTAANVRAKLDKTGDSLHWATLGVRALTAFEVDQLALFVRQNPGAPAEALWRYASAGALHDASPNEFDTALDVDRLPYEVFQAVLATVDQVIADLLPARVRRAMADAPPAEAVPFDPKGTMLERHGSMLAPADFVDKPLTSKTKPARAGKRAR